jgi:DNA-binding MarR family transcriptional regulator
MWRYEPTVKDRILGFLDRPRCAHEIAAHIERSGSYTTAYLSRLLERDLVERVARGVYALPCGSGPFPRPSPSLSPSPTQDRVLAFVTEPKTLREIAAHCGKSRSTTGAALRALIRAGRLRRVGVALYAGPPEAAPASADA